MPGSPSDCGELDLARVARRRYWDVGPKSDPAMSAWVLFNDLIEEDGLKRMRDQP